MWLKNFYENVLVDVKCKKKCVCNLESMLQLKQTSNDKVCAGIEFPCVFMLKLYDSARSKERIVVLAVN